MAVNLEKRIAALEAKVAEMEERRRKLVPRELDESPALQELQKNAIQSAIEKWHLTISENGGVTAAEFCELKRTFLREMEKAKRASDEREGAEVAAAIEFFARTGQSPPGYEISG